MAYYKSWESKKDKEAKNQYTNKIAYQPILIHWNKLNLHCIFHL